ncbi:MAG: hypothetical protein ACLFVU_06060, partial [Phycisphaerae bacterium]
MPDPTKRIVLAPVIGDDQPDIAKTLCRSLDAPQAVKHVPAFVVDRDHHGQAGQVRAADPVALRKWCFTG